MTYALAGLTRLRYKINYSTIIDGICIKGIKIVGKAGSENQKP